jgi:hypothetical protein
MRFVTQQLAARLPAGSLAEAAYGGLQDSAPRAAVLSLHARAEGVQPDDWEHPSLVQLWGPRAAVYVVPAEARGAFTLGLLPRSPEAAARLHRLAAEACDFLDGGRVRYGDVQRAVGKPFRWAAAPTGRLGICWDTRDTMVFETAAPEQDPEDARLELARRFLHWFAPATVRNFAKWAGITLVDAKATMDGLAQEVVTIDGALVLAADEPRLQAAAKVDGVRLLPPGDPYLFFRREVAGSGYTGVVLLDGKDVGTWLRRGGVVDVTPHRRLGPADRERIEAEALAFPVAADRRQVLWHRSIAMK